jgi:hypothetical protein
MILNDNDKKIYIHSIKLNKAELCVGPKLVPVRPYTSSCIRSGKTVQ